VGLAVLTALATSQQAQAMADRSGLLTAVGPSEDPRIKAIQQQGPGGAIPLWQHTQLQAQAQAYSNVFLVAGLCTLAGVIGAFFLPSGRPPASEGAMPIEI
jgi:hypothetical protein